MATLTLDIPDCPTIKRQTDASPRASFWRRLFDAIIESRTRKVEAEIAEHRRFMPRDYGFECRACDKAQNIGALPFVR